MFSAALYRKPESENSSTVNTPENEIVIITLSDTEPLLISDKPNILDKFKLKEARQKMDAAHNEIIKAKWNLAIEIDTPGLLTADNEQPEQSPFDILNTDMKRDAHPTTKEIQAAIDSKPYTDPKYRETAKDYLTKVLPVLSAEHTRLISELNKAEAELAEITQEYEKKVSKAEKNLQAFNTDVQEEWRKFETANNVKSVLNHTITTRDCRPIVELYDTSRQIDALKIIKEAIARYEHDINKDHSEEAKSISRSNARDKVSNLKYQHN